MPGIRAARSTAGIVKGACGLVRSKKDPEMKRHSVRYWRLSTAAIAGLACCTLASCQPLMLSCGDGPSSLLQKDSGHSKTNPQVCENPTVETLARDVDNLERHIDTYGSVVAQHPDVWGQARMTRHREEFEREMAKELNQFAFTLQAAVSRSDQAYVADALALSAAAAGGSSGANNGANIAVSNS